MAVEIRVPALGESVVEATVAAWMKQPGENISADETICELETDKVSLEVPSPVTGTLLTHEAAEGETVGIDALLATIEESQGAGSTKTEPVSGPPPSASPATQEKKRDVADAPSARRLMEESGVRREEIAGSGRDGRVMKHDVTQARSPAPSPATEPAPASAPSDAIREKRVRMTRLRQTIARRLKAAQDTAAILTTFNEVDMSAIMALRNEYKALFEQKHGVRLGFMSFFVRACVGALTDVPAVNAQIDGDEIVYRHYVHIGVAVGTPDGLVVPVLREAQSFGFAEIERRIAALGARARGGRLQLSELQGGTFTISNGGIYGSLMSTPILNPPQSGILGMHKIQERPVVVDGAVAIRPMMYLALSYDHRIIDGKEAVTFLVRVKEALEDPRRMLMDL